MPRPPKDADTPNTPDPSEPSSPGSRQGPASMPDPSPHDMTVLRRSAFGFTAERPAQALEILVECISKCEAVAFLITEYTWSGHASTEHVRESAELIADLQHLAFSQLEVLEKALEARQEDQP
jgi:hypothetical protein